MKRFAAVLALACILSLPAQAVELPISSEAAVLMEKETGSVLYAKNEHEALEPASVTKVMTLLLTMEAIDDGRLSYDDAVTGSAHAASMGGSQIWLKEGETFTVAELLKAVCVVSGNDAAVALGEHLAGSEDAFVARMNQRAEELGMLDTHFVNCTGLPADGHLTSAYDIALMSRELIAHHPDIRTYTTIWMDSLRGGASELVNTNKLIRFFNGATGLKTGSTGSAKYCISATAEREGMELIAVILKGETSDKRFADAKTLLNYGFSSYALHRVVPDEALPRVAVTLGERPFVQPILSQSDALLVPRESLSSLHQSITLCQNADAPVRAGDVLGELTIRDGENVLSSIPLIAGEDVARMTWGGMFLRFMRVALAAQ